MGELQRNLQCFRAGVRRNRLSWFLGGLALSVPLAISCHSAPPDVLRSATTLSLTSPAIREGRIAAANTCDGANASPELQWSSPPPAARSIALIVIDPDAPGGTFSHWVLFNLPASATALAAAMPAQPQLGNGARQGRNDFGDVGYGGPCPPGHTDHRYIFDLYALDTRLDLPSGAARQDVEASLKGHILAQGKLVGRYHR